MDDLPLKVLLLAGRFEVRGSSSYTLRLAENLDKHGVMAEIVCCDALSVEPEKCVSLGIREYRYLHAPLVGRFVRDLLRRDFLSDPPDLIHVQSRTMMAEGTWLSRKLDRPLVLTLHDYLQPSEQLRFDLQHGRRVIAVSDSVQDALLKQTGLAGELVSVIHGGVDRPTPAETSPVLDPDHVPVLGTAGPLEAVKGFPFFLGAAQKVLATGRDVEFLVSGAGPEEINLRRLARELDITSRVTFIPNLSDFSDSLSAMDIFCLTSLSQGLGTIMLEAMALGKPVIATRVGGVDTIVHDNQTGLTVPPADSSRLAERMLELLGDPVRARALGEAGRQTVRAQFGVEKMVARTAELYRRVLEKEEGTKYVVQTPLNLAE